WGGIFRPSRGARLLSAQQRRKALGIHGCSWIAFLQFAGNVARRGGRDGGSWAGSGANWEADFGGSGEPGGSARESNSGIFKQSARGTDVPPGCADDGIHSRTSFAESLRRPITYSSGHAGGILGSVSDSGCIQIWHLGIEFLGKRLEALGRAASSHPAYSY